MKSKMLLVFLMLLGIGGCNGAPKSDQPEKKEQPDKKEQVDKKDQPDPKDLADSKEPERDPNEETCVTCHRTATPGWVADWERSKHRENDISCSECHGDKHNSPDDAHLATFPSEQVCAECHDEQVEQFSKGKHSHGWAVMLAMPVTAMEPEELMAGGKGCGGCHNMGLKSEAQRKERQEKGQRYNNNSCDECHTRHAFDKREAQDPKACQQCHMGYDHPQYEMWSSSKHGTRYTIREKGKLHKGTSAPTCQFCHLPQGTHTNRVAWGFFAVRLPMPKDKQWAKDRTIILKALGVLNPKTGKPTDRLDTFKSLDFIRLTEEDWQAERDKMLATCGNCHSGKFARDHMEKADSLIRKADRVMAEAITIVAGLYEDGILKKPDHYKFAYPDLLYFKRTGGSYIEQVLLRMFLKHRMRTYQGVFHANPDYAYWYGWAAMTKSLGEIKELDRTLRATHPK